MKKNGSHLVWNQDFTFHLRRLKHADVRRDYNRPLVKLELYRTRMIRDEPLGWTEIPLNRVQYGSDYAQGSEKWHHLSTLRRTDENCQLLVNVRIDLQFEFDVEKTVLRHLEEKLNNLQVLSDEQDQWSGI